MEVSVRRPRTFVSDRVFLRKETIALEHEVILLDDTVNARCRNGKLPAVQTLNPALFAQIPKMKFQVLARTTEQPFHLDDAHAAPRRVSTPRDVQQGQNAIENALIAGKTIR